MSFDGSIMPGSRFTGRGNGVFSWLASCCSMRLVSCLIWANRPGSISFSKLVSFLKIFGPDCWL